MISLVLTYFDPKMGPTVYLSIPENVIDEELSQRIERFMDLDFGESSFEINLSDTEFKTFNHIINLPSRTSRGYVETFLLTIIADKNYNSERMFKFLKEANHKFLSYIEVMDDVSKSQEEVREVLADCRESLMDILKNYSADIETCQEIEKEEDYIDVLYSNLQNLTTHIAGKNEFAITNFKLKRKDNDHFVIHMELKGGGFLTRPLRKMTHKSVYDGVEKYMISNGIVKDNFTIEIK